MPPRRLQVFVLDGGRRGLGLFHVVNGKDGARANYSNLTEQKVQGEIYFFTSASVSSMHDLKAVFGGLKRHVLGAFSSLFAHFVSEWSTVHGLRKHISILLTAYFSQLTLQLRMEWSF